MNQENLIWELVTGGHLKTKRFIEAFRAVDRKDFVPHELAHLAYENQPLPIGFGQTISQPLAVAFLLEALEPQAGEKILDIGAGSGWQTALLAHIVSEPQINADGTQTNADISNQRSSARRVIAIERIPELAEMARKNVGKYGFIDAGVAEIILGDGTRGFEKEAPFDRIIAAASGKDIPQAWKDQVRIGGRIAAPVGEYIVVLDKMGEDEFREKKHFGFVFVPLVEEK